MAKTSSIGCVALFIAAVGAQPAQPDIPSEDTAAALAKFQADAAVLGLASNLSSILGSEAFCELHLDQAGIAAWIKANVPDDRMDFHGQLQIMTMGQQSFNDAMTASAKTAHCASVEQSARQAGLLAKP
jgi:hypothetical protein